ncbi:hypothetical protein DLJ46_10325 [Micromonospora globispora]|uniref:Amine oxidase domain-containing protein n=1 Tax=Micromonospora globispora TaxID=1450148 RepID=A0A317K798_9ACTN|nr:hypothetical protein DLJ46_10325 [Micromonospora globispora]
MRAFTNRADPGMVRLSAPASVPTLRIHWQPESETAVFRSDRPPLQRNQYPRPLLLLHVIVPSLARSRETWQEPPLPECFGASPRSTGSPPKFTSLLNRFSSVDYTGGNVAAAFNPTAPFLTASSAQVRGYAQTFLGQLEPVLPGVAGQWNGKATMSAWHTNPYAWGAYSYWPNGYPHRYAGYEAVRQGNVHFAGEHCSIDYQGYMEGGAQEGQRAAREVLTDLGIK